MPHAGFVRAPGQPYRCTEPGCDFQARTLTDRLNHAAIKAAETARNLRPTEETTQ